jgi:hypothetical protein
MRGIDLHCGSTPLEVRREPPCRGGARTVEGTGLGEQKHAGAGRGDDRAAPVSGTDDADQRAHVGALERRIDRGSALHPQAGDHDDVGARGEPRASGLRQRQSRGRAHRTALRRNQVDPKQVSAERIRGAKHVERDGEARVGESVAHEQDDAPSHPGQFDPARRDLHV